MGKIGQKNFHVPHQNQCWVYGAKKNFCPNELKFSTLAFGSSKMISEKIIEIG